MEYKVITEDNSRDLTQLVNYEISEGWEPLGSVSIGAYVEPKAYGESEYGQILAQAMIRRDKPLRVTNAKTSSTDAEQAGNNLRMTEAGHIVATKFNPDDAMRVIKWVPNFEEDKLETVTEYKIVHNQYLSLIEEETNSLLKQGYQLHGPITYVPSIEYGTGEKLLQVLTREVPKEKIY